MAENYKENLAQKIQEEEQLDIAIERVQKIASPLLVIGLGGTGASIVHAIKKTFAQRFELPRDERGNLIPIPTQTAYLAIDTDTNAQGTLTDDEFVNISVEGIDAILDPKQRDFNLRDYERQWVNRNLNASSSGAGAGTYRQSARFQLSRNYAKVEGAISSALTRVTVVQHGTGGGRGRVEIVIVAGICGGTGSGTFLDVPQIVRKCMESGTLAGQDYRVTGYIVMPDVSLSVPDIRNNPMMVRQLSMNGFAALKELDFWQNVASHKTKFTANLNGTRIDWKRAPYDACILMSQKTVDGVQFDKGFEVVENSIAENLLHYLANEAPTGDGTGAATFTYISHENNLKAGVTNMRKRLPLLYGYRAIGAYIKRIPKRKILYYEGSLLFNTFMPLRDDRGVLVPNDDLLKDGNTLKRAMAIVGVVSNLYNNFRMSVPLPGFCKTPSNDKAHLDMMRNMQIKPHEQADINPSRWQSTVVAPAARKAAAEYLKTVWANFTNFSQAVIANPKLGPFSLRDYLENQNSGLLKELRGVLNEWKNQAARFKSDLPARAQACSAFWADFNKPPILGSRTAIEKYLTALNEFYNQIVKIAFMEEHARAMSLFVQRAQEYLDLSLRPMCEDLDEMSKDFVRADVTDAKLESDLFALETVKQQIQSDFELNNAQDKTTLAFLNALNRVSLLAEESVDAQSTGLSFTYGVKRRVNLQEALRVELNQCFRQINNQSLDDIMLQAVGNNVPAQQKFMDDLAASIIDSSRPLFSQNAAVANEECVKYNFLSIPDNSQKFVQRYKNKPDVSLKDSSLRDHVYCVTSWDGLPLYRYGMLETLEKTYCDSLSEPDVCMGAHLVWDGDTQSNYLTNWCKLPSPVPYYFFQAHGTAFDERQYAEIHALTERAINAGMLEVDTSAVRPVYRLRAFYADSQREVVQPGLNIVEQAEAIRSLSRNPSTGSAYTPEEKLKMLEDLRASAYVEVIEPGQRPDCLATYMGLQNEPVDPNDPAIRVDALKLQKAKENYAKLSRELASVVVAGRPKLALTIAQQVDGFESIAKIINGIIGQANIWQPRIEYAENFALMYIHDLIRISMSGGVYYDESNQRNAIVQAEPDPEIADLDPVIMLPAYLADLGEKNQMRLYLEHALQLKENEIKEREMDDSLTKDDVQDLLDKVADLSDLVGEALKQENSKLVKMGADTATINKRIALLKNMQNLCDNRRRMYKRAMPR